jgi:diadenosine tetraphosphate (Ap4A) HIT family hydrolase
MDSCRLCKEEGGSLIWSGVDCRIVQVSDPELPGFCRVIWHQHVAEMSELNQSQRDLLMRVVVGVEEVIASTMKPAKINLASLGNQVPHLHWHIIPRYEDDPYFPDSIWSEKRRDTSESVAQERRLLADFLPGLIREQADRWLVSS